MKRRITVEIADSGRCEDCDFEHYDGYACYCQLFQHRLFAGELCEECISLRKEQMSCNCGTDPQHMGDGVYGKFHSQDCPMFDGDHPEICEKVKPCPCGHDVCQLTKSGWVCDKCRRPYLGDYEFGDLPTEEETS